MAVLELAYKRFGDEGCVLVAGPCSVGITWQGEVMRAVCRLSSTFGLLLELLQAVVCTLF